MTEDVAADAALAERDRRLGVLAHVAALAGLLLPGGQLAGPYLALLLMPGDALRPRAEAVEALNFQANVLAVVLGLTLVLLTIGTRSAWFLMFAPNVWWVGWTFWAATRASRGEAVRYPWTLGIVPRDLAWPPDRR